MVIPYFLVGVVVVIFIISITLLIFAPKSVNYYTSDIYPIIKFIHANNLDIIKTDLQAIKNKSDMFLKWPNENATKNYRILPLFMFSKVSKTRKALCSKTYTLLKNIPDVKTCAFLIMGANSSIKKHRKWKNVSNTTLSCLFVLEAPISNVDDCGIWVNGEAKKLTKHKMIIFDSSKEHSLYNNTDYPIYGLLLDVNRPKNIPFGASEVCYDTEVINFINKLL